MPWDELLTHLWSALNDGNLNRLIQLADQAQSSGRVIASQLLDPEDHPDVVDDVSKLAVAASRDLSVGFLEYSAPRATP